MKFYLKKYFMLSYKKIRLYTFKFPAKFVRKALRLPSDFTCDLRKFLSGMQD